MALTLAQARAQWVSANPFPITLNENGKDHQTTQAEYNAMADDRAPLLAAQSVQQEADAARIALRKKYQTAKTELAIAVTSANAVQRLTNTRTVLDGLIEILKDSGLLLDG